MVFGSRRQPKWKTGLCAGFLFAAIVLSMLYVAFQTLQVGLASEHSFVLGDVVGGTTGSARIFDWNKIVWLLLFAGSVAAYVTTLFFL